MKNNKLSKSLLKDLIKECLVDILAEGIVSKNSSETSSKKTSVLKESISSISDMKSKKRTYKPKYLDSIDESATKKENKIKNKKLDKLASSITADPILTEMLIDTAHTTLQEQINAESQRGYTPKGKGDEAQKIVESSTPESLFGEETAGKWASLAFGS